MSVGLAITMLNEAASLGAFLEGVARNIGATEQTVLVDGGSTDGTWQALQRWARDRSQVVVAQLPGAGISRGRNHAIELCQTQLVVVTDAGCTLPHGWVEAMAEPLVQNHDVSLVKGRYRGEGATFVGRGAAIALVNSSRSLQSPHSLPSSRAIAFRRRDWERLGGYPEWLDTAEDTLFAQHLTSLGRMAYVPDPPVVWHVRGSLRAIFGQYRRYAEGDRAAGTNAALGWRILAVWIAALTLVLRGRSMAGVALLLGYILRRGDLGLARHPQLLPAACLAVIASDAGRLTGSFLPRTRRESAV